MIVWLGGIKAYVVFMLEQKQYQRSFIAGNNPASIYLFRVKGA